MFIDFLRNLIGMGVPLNAISTGLDFCHCQVPGTALDALVHQPIIWRREQQYTDEAFSFQTAISRYLFDQGAALGGTKILSDYGVVDRCVMTALPILKRNSLYTSNGKKIFNLPQR